MMMMVVMLRLVMLGWMKIRGRSSLILSLQLMNMILLLLLPPPSLLLLLLLLMENERV